MLRFAPSPTGDMHIGNLRIALLNYLIAEQQKDRFLIRINDTDTKQNIEGKDTEIMQILEKFALTHTSVFHQSEHLHMHQTLAIKLLEENKAFICTCIPEKQKIDSQESYQYVYPCTQDCENKDKKSQVKLKESDKPFVLRLKKPISTIVFNDELQGKINIDPDAIDTIVILHENGMPSALFAAACDDMISGITMVLDSHKYLLNTAKQIHIKKQLGYDEKNIYAHVPTMTNAKEFTIQELFAQGYIPDAIINALLLLDNPNTPKEIFTLPEAMKWFSLKEIPTSEVTFNIQKLRNINREHLRCIDDKQLSSLFGFADAEVGKLVKLYLEEASTINELSNKIRPIFAAKNFEGKWKDQMILMQKCIADAPMIHTFDAFTSYLMKTSGLEGEAFSKPLRLLLTGAENGPELSDIYPHIKAYLLEVAS